MYNEMAGKKSTSNLNNQHHSAVDSPRHTLTLTSEILDYSKENPLPLRTRSTAVNTAAVDKHLNTNINIALSFSNSAMLNTWNRMRTNDMSIVFDMTSPHNVPEVKINQINVWPPSMNNENEESFEENNCTAAANIVAQSHNLDTHESQNNTLTEEEKEAEVNADQTKSKSSSDLTLKVVENFDAAGVINHDNAADSKDAYDNEINDNGEDNLSQNSNDSSIIYVSSSNIGIDEELKRKTIYQGNNNETLPMTTLSESKHVNHNKRELDDAISSVSKKHTIDIISSHSVFPPSSSLLSIDNNLPPTYQYSPSYESPSTSNSLPKPVADKKGKALHFRDYADFKPANSRIIDEIDLVTGNQDDDDVRNEREKKTVMPVFDRVREGCSFCRNCSCEIYAVNDIFFAETKNNFDMSIYALKLSMFSTNTFTPQPFALHEVCQVYSDSTNEKLNCSQLFTTPNNSPGNFAFLAVTAAMTNKSHTPKPDWNICFNACLCDYNIVFPSKRNLRSMNNSKAKCDLYIGLFSLDDDFFIQINLKKINRIFEKYPDFQLRFVPCPEIKKHESILVRVKKSTIQCAYHS